MDAFAGGGRRWGLVAVLLVIDLGLAASGAYLLSQALADPAPASTPAKEAAKSSAINAPKPTAIAAPAPSPAAATATAIAPTPVPPAPPPPPTTPPPEPVKTAAAEPVADHVEAKTPKKKAARKKHEPGTTATAPVDPYATDPLPPETPSQ